MMKIDYTKIDPLCIPMVKFFNSVGLTTKHSCQGHDNHVNNKFYIIFADEISDKDISGFLKKLSIKFNRVLIAGHFYKWIREKEYAEDINGNWISNWMYQVDVPTDDYRMNQRLASDDLKLMTELYCYFEFYIRL